MNISQKRGYLFKLSGISWHESHSTAEVDVLTGQKAIVSSIIFKSDKEFSLNTFSTKYLLIGLMPNSDQNISVTTKLLQKNAMHRNF